MRKLILFTALFVMNLLYAQNNEWHVNHYADNYAFTSSTGGTSLANAWTIREALENTYGLIKPGDIVWLHGGEYHGHFVSTLSGTASKYVTVKSYPGEWAVLNGYIDEPGNTVTLPNAVTFPEYHLGAILYVIGAYVQYESFEVTCLGNFTRLIDPNCNQTPAPNNYTGIRHDLYKDKFVNLVIRNVPGVAFGSWKSTEDTEIYGCLFYYNGQLTTDRPNCATPLTATDSGNTEGKEMSIYTQNISETKTRLFKNNMFLNNYKSGVGIWSAPTSGSEEFLHDYLVTGNVFLNNNSPCWDSTANMIVASNNPNNKPYDVRVTNNLFYVNSKGSYFSGLWVSNTRGVEVDNNFVYNGALGFAMGNNSQKVKFHHNLYFGRYTQVASVAEYQGSGNTANAWYMNDNKYYIRTAFADNVTNFIHTPTGNMGLNAFNAAYATTGIVAENNSSAVDGVNPPARNTVTQNEYNPYLFYVTIWDRNAAATINVDFSGFVIPNYMSYTVRDAQNYFTEIILPGTNNNQFDSSNPVIPFPTNLTAFEMPLPATGVSYVGTGPAHSPGEMNVFIVEFQCKIPFDLTISNITHNGWQNPKAKNNITFGPSYIASSTSTVDAMAGRQVRFVPGTTIQSGSTFHAWISRDVCPSIGPLFEPFERDQSSNSDQRDIAKAEQTFTVYPNPSNGLFKIESQSAKITSVDVIGIETARSIFTHQSDGKNQVDVDIAKAQPGIYIVKVTFDNNETQTKTIIKQ